VSGGTAERAHDLAERLRGRALDELPTPVALLDLDALERNIAQMADRTRGRVRLRPHAKTHKCAEIALRQVAAGALGVTVATPSECLAIARAGRGVGEILIANELADRVRIATAVEAAALVPVIVSVDDAAAVAALGRAAAERGATVGVVIEVDVGMHRGGTREIGQSTALVDAIGEWDHLVMRGLTGYEGHAVLERDVERRTAMCATAMELLAEHVAAVRNLGAEVEIVAAGGTNTHQITATHEVVTELQAGTYALMDTAYRPYAPDFEPAMTVLASVSSVHGTRAILACGSKVHAVTELAPAALRARPGTILELHEEHTLLEVPAGSLALDDRVEIVVGYCGGTVNLHDYYVVVSDGVVRDVWPILGRGPGWP
jgi:3-hydroxy-D-aspartate aldolase